MKLSPELKKLGDFTTTMRVLPISCLAMVIGLIAAGRVRLTGTQVLLDGSALVTPLQVSESGDADGAPT